LAGAAEVIRPVAAHQMGMTATVINGLALSEALTSKGCEVLLTCAMPAGAFTELYCPQNARKAMAQGQIVVLTGGTGNSFVTTDTCAAIRAADLGVDGLLKATKVDGVYDADPRKHPNAKRFAALGYQEMIDRRLGVMDLPAVLICQQAKVPIVVFDFQTPDSVARIVTGKAKGSVVN
jgi:uridylate kinase